MDPVSGLDSDSVAVFGFPSAGAKSSKPDMLQLVLLWVVHVAHILSRLTLGCGILFQKNCGWTLEK